MKIQKNSLKVQGKIKANKSFINQSIRMFPSITQVAEIICRRDRSLKMND